MNLQQRIELLYELGQYIISDDENWKSIKEKANAQNNWFTPEFIDKASKQISENFLDKNLLKTWLKPYEPLSENNPPKTVGVVMAGNIPLVGFHDLLCVFISGNNIMIKVSSKDEVLIKHLVEKLIEWNESLSSCFYFEVMLKGCDAYIATGSNNSSRYFEYYFGKYPNIIRKNRTSVALLEGNETSEELSLLADDVYTYFGLGCRNVTKIYVPHEYDFVPLLRSFDKYNYLSEHHKFKNNYDYNLAIHILNNKFYMSNESIILFENESLFSPISQLNYEFYTDKETVLNKIKSKEELQCIVGHSATPFGQSQFPSLTDYADGVDTLRFLSSL